MEARNHSVNCYPTFFSSSILIQKIIISLYQFMDILFSSEILDIDAVTEL